MRIPSYIRRAINSWIAWKARRSLRKAVPALVALDSREAETRRLHKAGARELASQRQRLVTERLRMEMGRA